MSAATTPDAPGGPGARRRRTLDDVVDRRANGLNAVRLVLASTVVFWHAFPLSGRDLSGPWGVQLLGQVAVDGFFAISGFLLAGSWLHRPDLVAFVRNRLLRLMPAFWTCLVVTAVVFAPVSVLLQGGDLRDLLSGPHSAVRYVTDNAALWMRFYDVAGTPTGVPVSGVWNGSLWTLRWEAFAYACLALVGVLGLLRRRWFVLAALAVCWAAAIGVWAGVVPDSYYPRTGARLGLMFVAGVALHVFRRQVPAGPWAAVVAAALVVVAGFTDDYRVLAGPAVAFLVVWCGGVLRSPALRLEDRDVSYGVYIYGFPVQQLLVLLGAAAWPPVLLGAAALVLAAPLAVASWVLVERPALRFKGRSRRRVDPPVPGRDAAPSP